MVDRQIAQDIIQIEGRRGRRDRREQARGEGRGRGRGILYRLWLFVCGQRGACGVDSWCRLDG